MIPVGKLTDNLVVISGAGHLSELIGFLEQGDMFQPCGGEESPTGQKPYMKFHK
ncbi:hypothetical protein PCC21_032440 [Pectobacterium carotovorum subsp. carotovorum PCC21]|nr:hypothetical protein PCC21_032440 [Pectobacterium carotovorum subsp. carotovorum PCC21]